MCDVQNCWIFMEIFEVWESLILFCFMLSSVLSIIIASDSCITLFILYRDDEIPQASVNLALSILSLGTSLNTDGGFPEASSNIKLESAVTGSLFLLKIASSSR